MMPILTSSIREVLYAAASLLRFCGCVLSRHSIDGVPPEVISIVNIDSDLAIDIVAALDAKQPLSSPESKLGMLVSQLAVNQDNPSPTCQVQQYQYATVLRIELMRTGRSTWILSMIRPDRVYMINSDTQRDINLVVQILSQVLRTELRLGRLSASRATGWVVLNQLRLGVVIVDSTASISLANRAGIAALRAHAGVGVRNGQLTFERPADQAKLRETLAKMAEAGSPPVQSLCLGPHPEGLLLHLTLLRLHELPERIDPRRVAVAVFVTDPRNASDVSTNTLRALYGLTRLEAEIVALIASGATPVATASRTRMSVHTVRSYLKVIYQKMGVHRQSDMVRAALSCSGLVDVVAPASSNSRPSRTADSLTPEEPPLGEVQVGSDWARFAESNGIQLSYADE